MKALVGQSLALALVVPVLFVSCKGRPDEPKGSGEEDLATMREECAKIMPKTFSKIWVGMKEQDLKIEKPDAKFQAHRTDPLERRWYNEMSPTGVSVWYGVDRATERLAVVQFAHRFVSWDVFRSHATALQDRFGTDYELYTCPSDPARKASMTRLLWPRNSLGVMEAVLEMGDSISVTMLVGVLSELRQGVEKQNCSRVDRDKAMEAWVDEMVQREEEALRRESQEAGVTPPPGPVPPPEPSGTKEEK